MNTSLRRISVMIMALIVLLLAQRHDHPGVHRRRPARRSAQPAGAARRVLPPARPDHRGRPAAGLLGVHRRPLPVPAGLSRTPIVYAPVTGFYSLRYSSTGLERAEDAILNGSDERLFGRRLADFFTGRDPRGGNVDTTINPAGPAGRLGRDAAGLQRRRARAPSSRWSRPPARSWRWCPSPSYDPNLLATHDADEQADGLAAAARRPRQSR